MKGFRVHRPGRARINVARIGETAHVSLDGGEMIGRAYGAHLDTDRRRRLLGNR